MIYLAPLWIANVIEDAPDCFVVAYNSKANKVKRHSNMIMTTKKFCIWHFGLNQSNMKLNRYMVYMGPSHHILNYLFFVITIIYLTVTSVTWSGYTLVLREYIWKVPPPLHILMIPENVKSFVDYVNITDCLV